VITHDVLLPLSLAAVGALYLRGWWLLSLRMPARFDPRRLAAFAGGLAAVGLALVSPLETLARSLLQAHMAQHLLLMVVAPPLLWLGAPVAPLLLGLPRRLRRRAALALAARPIRRLTGWLAQPALAWAAFVTAFWLWHIPALYDLALRSDGWYHVEHASFFVAGLLFWRPVILPWPSRPVWPRWAMLPYLLLAELQNASLAAILTFADRVLYRAYEALPTAGRLSALEDQSLAGVIMWVPGSLPFLLPVIWLVLHLSTPQQATLPLPSGE